MVSIEQDTFSHQTLTLRQFLRFFSGGGAHYDYHALISRIIRDLKQPSAAIIGAL